MDKTYRDAWIEALNGLVPFEEHLKATTEAAYGSTEPTAIVWCKILIGLRGRRLLQGARLLAAKESDDLVANLARALIDSHIEAEYLEITSTFGKAQRRRTHRPEDKARLFAAQQFALLDMKTERLTLQQGANQAAAIELRKSLGVRGHTWHGRTTADLLEDLRGHFAPGEQRGVDGISTAFRLGSFFEHNNANPNFYIERTTKGTVRVLDGVRHSWPIQASAQAGAGVLNRWGEALGVSEAARIKWLDPVLRMTAVDPMSFPSDS